MSVPTEFDWVLVKKAGVLICGIQDVTINRTVNTSDRFVRDCANMGAVPSRKTKANGKQLDITGTGLSNADQVTLLDDALGEVEEYDIEGYREDGTDAGTLLGTFNGEFRLTAVNLSTSREGTASGEITLANHGDWTYTAA